MKNKQIKEIKLNDVTREAIKQDRNFLTKMKDGDAKAVVLNDGVVVAFKKIKEIGERKVEMEVTCCLQSIRIDANLTEDDDEEGLKLSVTVCPYCKTQRSDSKLNGLCRFCNTPLANKEIELPKMNSSQKESAEKFLKSNKSTGSTL